MAARKSTKARTWGYGELTVTDIIDCALRLIERDGVAKLTMRRLAEDLGMSSMITYYYVSSKQEVLDLVIDRVYEAIEIPPPESGDWAERLKGMCLESRQQLIRYPGLIPVIQTRPLAPNAVRLANALSEILVGSGDRRRWLQSRHRGALPLPDGSSRLGDAGALARPGRRC